MARAKTKKSVNLMVQSRWDGRTGTATQALPLTHGRKGFRGYVGPHDTIRGYRSPKQKVIPGSQGKPTPETLYKVVWHTAPPDRYPSPPTSSWSPARSSQYSRSISVHRNEILSHIYKDMTEKDYYSQDDITILTKEN